MNLPRCLFACFLLLAFYADSKAQERPSCSEIKVEMKVEIEMTEPSKTSKVVLKFEEQDYKDFNLFLFAGRESDNRLNLKTSEIKNLKKGDYTLIIQNADRKKFCTKQFKFKVN